MSVSQELKADLIMKAIGEDRSEIRLISQRLYNIIYLLTVSSFVITAFLLGLHPAPLASVGKHVFVLVDVAFLLMLWVLFLRLLSDLKGGQLCLEAREEMLRRLTRGDDIDEESFDVFPVVPLNRSPNVNYNGFYWIVSTSTIAICIKLTAVLIL